MEFESVLHSHVAAHRAVDESVLVLNVGLEGQSGLALIVDIGYCATCHLDERLAYLIAKDVHSYRVGLHHGCIAIAVDDESRQVVALAMHQSERVVVGTAYESDGLAHLPCRSQARGPELSVNLNVAEREHTHGDATYLEHSDSNEIARGCDDTHKFAFLHAFVHIGYGSGEYPRMKALQTLFLAFLQI